MTTTTPTLPESIKDALREYAVQFSAWVTNAGDYDFPKADTHLRATIAAALVEQALITAKTFTGRERATTNHLLNAFTLIEDALSDLNAAHRLAYQHGELAIGQAIHDADGKLRAAQAQLEAIQTEALTTEGE